MRMINFGIFHCLQELFMFNRFTETLSKYILPTSKNDDNIITITIVPWYSGYNYCTTSFNKVWTQVLRGFKSCLRRVRDLRWWESLTVVPAGNKSQRLSLVNHSAKTIHHQFIIISNKIMKRHKATHKWSSVYILPRAFRIKIK